MHVEEQKATSIITGTVEPNSTVYQVLLYNCKLRLDYIHADVNQADKLCSSLKLYTLMMRSVACYVKNVDLTFKSIYLFRKTRRMAHKTDLLVGFIKCKNVRRFFLFILNYFKIHFDGLCINKS